MKLTDKLSTRYKIYRLNLAYDRVLRVLDAMEDDQLSTNDKIYVAIKLLVKWPRPVTFAGRAFLWQKIYLNFLASDAKPQSGPRAFDFEQDAEYIFAAFRQAYGIDLAAEKLDWRKFIALFSGLPSGTRMSEIMELRLQPLPKPCKGNEEYRRAIIKAKRAVALKPKHGDRTAMDKHFDTIFAKYKAGDKNA